MLQCVTFARYWGYTTQCLHNKYVSCAHNILGLHDNCIACFGIDKNCVDFIVRQSCLLCLSFSLLCQTHYVIQYYLNTGCKLGLYSKALGILLSSVLTQYKAKGTGSATCI